MFESLNAVSPISMRTLITAALFSTLATTLPSLAATTPLRLSDGPAAGLELKKTLPPIPLRGYGTVAGQHWASADGGSILEMTCDSEAHAKLTLAKYISDLNCLPGVTTVEAQLRKNKVSVHEVKGQGVLAALRSGTSLFVLAAQDRTALEKLATALKGDWSSVVSAPEVSVPMWLDRFDKHGFRFYYAPFTFPPADKMPKGQPLEMYDFTQDFEFARKNKAGLVMWMVSSKESFAEGLNNDNWFGWVQRWAKDWNLPLGCNLESLNFHIPNWVANRYRQQLQQQMPQYLGDSMSIAGWRGTAGNVGELAWGATEARDALLGSLQQTVRRLAADPNITTWLEPHGEFYQGGDALMGYGPAVDATFREYLKNKYKQPAALKDAWGMAVRDWSEVKAPELAEFTGWGPQALDLSGTWRVNYPKEQGPELDKLFAEDCDDTSWTSIVAPGDDHAFFIPKKPAVYRRSFDLPADRFKKGERAWIYLWDLNVAWEKPVSVWLNGQKIGESLCHHPHAHWMTCEATGALREKDNKLAIGLPNGYIAYRVYLSPTEPKQYPNLGPGLNAKWADFVDWREAMRIASARRGIEMIREVDPNRQIDLMQPGISADGLKGLAEDYGANFKDTGFMCGVWAELLPHLMRGSGMPFTLEPGGPAGNPRDFRRSLGLWSTEGVHGVDYFIHLGSVSWNPEITKTYEETLPLWQLFGKHHCAQADVAILWDKRIETLTGFPWGFDLNTNNPGGWSCRGIPEGLVSWCPRDGLTEGDFARGNVARYKVIIDTNTSIMDEDLLAQIEKYVKDGGIFVTLGTTGRHSPTQFNSWPIAKLTGYEVLTLEKFRPGQSASYATPEPGDNNPGSPWQSLAGPAPEQRVYPKLEEWMKSGYLTGLRMKKVAPDAQDLLLWKDGTVAVGMRKIGKGCIIEMGCKSNGGGVGLALDAFGPILDMAGVRRNLGAVRVTTEKPRYFQREYVSNNGLYDVWVIYNEGGTELAMDLTIKGKKPASALDLQSATAIPVNNGCLEGIKIPPNHTRVYLTPRLDLGNAALEWLELQRSWWRGTKQVAKGFSPPPHRYTRALDDDWAWHAMAEGESGEKLADPAFDDSKWERMRLGIWSAPERLGVKRAIFRKTITVPAEWEKGCCRLWLRGTGYPDFFKEGRMFLDGKLALNRNFDRETPPPAGEEVLKAGTKHTIAIEASGPGVIAGTTADCWLSFVPEPVRKIDLHGTWATTKDMFQGSGQVNVPGRYEAKTLRRAVEISKEDAGKNLVLVIQSERMFSVFVNNTYLPFSGGPNKGGNEINITPYLRFGEKNDIQLVSVYERGAIDYLSLHVYDRTQNYP
ncbi:MAG TPA: beta-galactosidase [Planctomycetota bacterium]